MTPKTRKLLQIMRANRFNRVGYLVQQYYTQPGSMKRNSHMGCWLRKLQKQGLVDQPYDDDEVWHLTVRGKNLTAV